MIDLPGAMLRELLFWAPHRIEFDLIGALFHGARAAPVDLRLHARRAGLYCLEGPVHSRRPGGMHGSGQLVWSGAEAQLRLYLAESGCPAQAWLGTSEGALRLGLPAGAEFTGRWNDGSTDSLLTLRLDYRGLLRRWRFSGSCPRMPRSVAGA